MQNIHLSQSNHARRTALFAFVFTVLLCLLALPQHAYAKSYAMPSVDIQAEVNTDGSLHVVEQRTFDFNGSFTCVWWEFNKMSYPKVLRPNSVAIAFPSLQGNADELGASGAGGVLPEVPFEVRWRSEGGPGYDAYSFDETYDAIYVFFEASDTEMVVTLDYTVENAVTSHPGFAELYWQYIGSDWAEDSRSVTCTIALPAGTKAEVGKDVRAWGHGPLSGNLSFDEAGTTVTYSVPRVKSGEYAEARMVFPNAWLSLPAGYEAQGFKDLADILSEEQAEAAKANRGRIASVLFFGLFGLVSLISIVWAAIKLVREGLEYKPNFRGDYWRDVPNKDVHPAVIGRLCRWDAETPSDVLVTILHLANLGAISINKGVKGTERAPRGRYQNASAQEDYYLQLHPEVANTLTNPIDTNLIEFLFGEIAPDPPNENTLWLDDIDTWGEKHAKSFGNKLKKWQSTVSREVKKQQYFEEKGEANQGAAWMLAIALVVVGAYISFEFAGNFWPLIILGVTAVVVFLLSINMPRRTQNGADDYARAQGLKKWLKDFTLLNERIPTDVKVWGEFMVYAQLFGVAKETIKKLRAAVPELFTAGDSRALSDSSYVPWDTWYVSDSLHSSAGDSFARSFDSMWTNTASTAATAVSASSGGGGGGWSSGGGFGGGFSGGGGGGFGGGGGGAR